MKKNRYIPFGYTMKNGRIIIDKAEASIVRDIYQKYVSGASLKEIAEELTENNVPYSEKMTDWGKARVARIIQNTKYLGDAEFDKIIDDSLFFEVAAVKAARLTSVPGDLNTEISAVKSHIRCIHCGYPMSRKSRKRYKTSSIWSCINPACGFRAGISDADLLEAIMRILKRIKNNERLLDQESNSDSNTPVHLTDKFNSALEMYTRDEHQLLRIIFALASEQYSNIDLSAIKNADALKTRIRRIEIRENFSPALFDAVTSFVKLGDGHIELITKNNVQIGECYGSTENTEKDSNGNTTKD